MVVGTCLGSSLATVPCGSCLCCLGHLLLDRSFLKEQEDFKQGRQRWSAHSILVTFYYVLHITVPSWNCICICAVLHHGKLSLTAFTACAQCLSHPPHTEVRFLDFQSPMITFYAVWWSVRVYVCAGLELLYQPEVVRLYLSLLKLSHNQNTLEAAAGALQNLSAGLWAVSRTLKK